MFFCNLIPKTSNLHIDLQFEIFYNLYNEKSIFLLTKKVRGLKMATEDKTKKEKLIEFIHNLTTEEADYIISVLQKEKEQA